jgi:hypothetical protein
MRLAAIAARCWRQGLGRVACRAVRLPIHRAAAGAAAYRQPVQVPTGGTLAEPGQSARSRCLRGAGTMLAASPGHPHSLGASPDRAASPWPAVVPQASFLAEATPPAATPRAG